LSGRLLTLSTEGIEAASCSPGPVSGGGIQRHIDPYIMLVLCWGNVIRSGKHVYTVRMYYKLILKVENYPEV
jgi:hypothetical protein